MKLKGKSLVKKGFAKLGDFTIPVKIRGYSDKQVLSESSKLKAMDKIPKKTRLATPAEKESLKKEMPEIDFNGIVKIMEIDKANEEFIKLEEEMADMAWAILIVNHIDFDYVDETEGDFWTANEIEKGNYIEFARMIKNELQPTQSDIEIFFDEIKKIASKKPTIAELEINIKEQEKAVLELESKMKEVKNEEKSKSPKGKSKP